jgi:integrase
MDASTIGTTILPLRAIYRQALDREEVAVNPPAGLRLPAVRGGRDRIAPPHECAMLLAALRRQDRALWAVAMYGGLRRGELRALRSEDVNLGRGVIEVRRGWDAFEGRDHDEEREGPPRPIPVALRDYLDEHLLGLARREQPEGLVFGVSRSQPFAPTAAATRAKRAWKAAKLDPITMHECRHTFAPLMIAAGVNANALSTYMGHATATDT